MFGRKRFSLLTLRSQLTLLTTQPLFGANEPEGEHQINVTNAMTTAYEEVVLLSRSLLSKNRFGKRAGRRGIELCLRIARLASAIERNFIKRSGMGK